jgi:hypothetical protein
LIHEPCDSTSPHIQILPRRHRGIALSADFAIFRMNIYYNLHRYSYLCSNMYEYHMAMDVLRDSTNTSVGWLVLLQPYIHRNMTELIAAQSLLDYVLITSSATVVNKMNLSQRPPPLRQLVQQQVRYSRALHTTTSSSSDILLS